MNPVVVGEAMPTTKNQASAVRLRLLKQIKQLAQAAIYGSLSETYRRCGNPDCRCHHGGPKHGPHLYISYRGKTGKTTGYYVPHYAEAQIRQGVDAWSQLQDCLRELAALKRRASSRSSKKITTYFATAFRLWSKRATPYGLESVMNTPQLVESLGCF